MKLEGIATLLLCTSLGNGFALSGGYEPSFGACDASANFLREAAVSENEQKWLQKRLANARVPLKEYLERVWTNYDDKSVITEMLDNEDVAKVPKIGIAVAGGGYVAMFAGAGMVAAMDDRTVGAKEHGLGGILQASSYLSGLSGGSWMVGTLALNNWTSVQSIIDNTPKKNSIWDITHSIVAPGGIHILQTTARFFNLFRMAAQKRFRGFDITVTDIWGPALAYNFMPSLPNGGSGTLWTDISNYDPFVNAEMPLPIILAEARNVGETKIDTSSTIIEINPWELGSWDRSLNAFFDLRYIGTKVSNGKPLPNRVCYTGLDQASFLMGASSNVFNQHMTGLVWQIFTRFVSIFTGGLENDVAVLVNPFKDSQYTAPDYKQKLSSNSILALSDGGSDLEGIPLNPLIQKKRELDAIFALDLWGYTDSLPSGGTIGITYNRQFTSQGNNTVLPQVPDEATFGKEGLNQRPVFFGCYPEDLTEYDQVPPVIIYIPNRDLSYPPQNILKLAYTPTERIKAIRNGFESATANNLTQYKDFNACVGCAVMKRKQEKLGLRLPSECETCFKELCWRPPSASSPKALASPVVSPVMSQIPNSNIESVKSLVSVPSGSDLSAVISTISDALLLSNPTSTFASTQTTN